MDRVGFLQVKKRKRQYIHILKLQVLKLQVLDPITGIPPLKLKLYKLLQINILKQPHLKMAQISVLHSYGYKRL